MPIYETLTVSYTTVFPSKHRKFMEKIILIYTWNDFHSITFYVHFVDKKLVVIQPCGNVEFWYIHTDSVLGTVFCQFRNVNCNLTG